MYFPHEPKTPTTLVECPIGLFLHEDTLCLKTEYGNNEGRIDAYIVSTGEFFWGDSSQKVDNQRKQLVIPLSPSTLYTPEQISTLADAMAQLLDDMGKSGTCVAPIAKALARVAYEPFCDHPDWEPDMTLEQARSIVDKVSKR